jgi:hypothetical protein
MLKVFWLSRGRLWGKSYWLVCKQKLSGSAALGGDIRRASLLSVKQNRNRHFRSDPRDF